MRTKFCVESSLKSYISRRLRADAAQNLQTSGIEGHLTGLLFICLSRFKEML